MTTGWSVVCTGVLLGVLSGGAMAEVTGSYDGQLAGGKVVSPVPAAATLSQSGKFLTGTVALQGDPAPISGAYLVSGKATAKKVKLSGGNPSGAILKWTGKIVGTTLQGKAKLKGPGTKLAGTLALTLNASTADGSACDGVYTQNTALFGQVLSQALTACTTCHVAGGQAGATRFRVTLTDPLATARSVALQVDSANPSASRILGKSTGQLPHGGGVQITAGSPAEQLLTQWVGLVAQAGCN